MEVSLEENRQGTFTVKLGEVAATNDANEDVEILYYRLKRALHHFNTKQENEGHLGQVKLLNTFTDKWYFFLLVNEILHISEYGHMKKLVHKLWQYHKEQIS